MVSIPVLEIAVIGGRRQHQPESEPVKKMGPQNSRLDAVKGPLHPDGGATVHFHQSGPLQVPHTPRPCRSAKSSPSVRRNFPSFRHPFTCQFVAAAFPAPDASATVKVVDFQFALVMAHGICTADFFLVVHAVVDGAFQPLKVLPCPCSERIFS